MKMFLQFTLIACFHRINFQRSILRYANSRIARIDVIRIEHPFDFRCGISVSFAIQHDIGSENDIQVVWILQYLRLFCENDMKLVILNSFECETVVQLNCNGNPPRSCRLSFCPPLFLVIYSLPKQRDDVVQTAFANAS